MTRKLKVTQTIKLLPIGLSLLFSMMLSGCNGSSDGPPCSRSEDACVVESTEPTEIWWAAPSPDFSDNKNRPVISLLGDRTLSLSIGDSYLEEGAMAIDEQDGDISSQVEIHGQVNTSLIGDYLVRYSVTDSSGLIAIEKMRIIRVKDGSSEAENFSRRPLGSTIANFGYLEHLPVDYGMPADQKPPLLIYLHGSGGNVQFANTSDPTLALDAIINNYGLPKIIEEEQWDDSLPFVVVTPHLGAVPDLGYMERLDAFVEYAIRAYDIDTSRVYLSGWSNGGFISFEYAINFPDKIAAVAPMSSGLPYDTDALPNFFCNIEKVPVWLFHGTSDEVIPFSNTNNGYNAIIDECQSRVLPRSTLIVKGEHAIHHAVFDLTAMVNGSMDAKYDTRFEPYDISIYQWLLSHSLDDR